jgi:FKBP-type peptidyl-prolyl cis-trans isomerase FkpA
MKNTNHLNSLLNGILVSAVVGTGALTLGPTALAETPKAAAAKPNTESNTITTTASGLRYTDTAVGTGAEAVKGKQVSVHYTGWILGAGDAKGAKFDSSLDRGQPFRFALGAGMVIQGWDEGVAGMKVGGKRTLMIPSKLGYGTDAVGPIPANSNLVFDVELLAVQ